MYLDRPKAIQYLHSRTLPPYYPAGKSLAQPSFWIKTSHELESICKRYNYSVSN